MSSPYSCLTCAKSFTSAGALHQHAQHLGHTANPRAVAAAMAATFNQVYLCGHCTKRTAFTTPAALRAHVAGRHTGTPQAPLGPPPAYSARPPPSPVHVPRPSNFKPAGPAGQSNYTCKGCPNSKFATMDALRAHQAAKHAMNFTPARSAPATPAKQRPTANAPRPSAKSSYSEVDLKVLVKTSG